jgi:uncharacterized membrane protein YhiD involved in acid resistance
MFETFEEYLAVSRVDIPIVWFILNLLLTAVLAITLNHVYIKYGNSLSNRRLFGRNFLLLTMTTMIIITIVKSSLALSLGLVGALSIIRFRAAIKEPEELAFLFLAIAIGLGFGANQAGITVVAFFTVVVILILVKKFSQKGIEHQNLFLTLNSKKPLNIDAEKIVKILRNYCSEVTLKRLDENEDVLEISFLIELKDFDNLIKMKKTLSDLDKSIQLTFLDNKGII